MPQLTVILDNAVHVVPFTPGSSVREILDAAGLSVRSACLGNGACGLCLVRVEGGEAGVPTPNESLFLAPEQIERNTRFACQLTPEGDLSIRILNTGSKSDWRELGPGDLACTPPHLEVVGQDPGLGLAVDLGTTHICFSLWDLERGDRLCGRAGLNPQRHYGADVVARLVAARESPEHAERIARMALDAVHEGLLGMRSRGAFSPDRIIRVAIVGNTPMLAMLTQTDSRMLLQPGFWESPIDCRLDDFQSWVRVLGINPEATVEVVAPLAGFVGSDLLAGVLATGLTDHPGGMLIDFGTNSEVALWDGQRLWATSAAGGPAFESSQMQCGMPAERGAIYRVGRNSHSPEWHFQVIGGGEAQGICGSGLVDLIASLRGTGDLKSTGRFVGQVPDLPAPEGRSGNRPTEDGFSVPGTALRLTHSDVDMFQRAKAAIAVGIRTLLRRARMDVAGLHHVCVCGAFGQDLDPGNAQAIGLLPATAPERVELCGNTALAGCERLLLREAAAPDLAWLRERSEVINLAQSSDFEELFLESLFLRPLKVDDR